MTNLKTKSNTSIQSNEILIILSALALAIMFVSTASLYLLGETSEVHNIAWAIITFGGFALLVIFLFAGATIFRSIGVHDPRHSLALPRNSVRSLLTFLIFVMLLGFIFYSTNVLTNDQETGIATFPSSDEQSVITTLEIQGKIIQRTVDGDNVTLSYNLAEDKVIVDYFDRILIALLGISSTIIGFYFGSRSREDLSLIHI